MQRSVRWGELRAPELRDLAGTDAAVIVPVASIEQHGPHLPTLTDTLLAETVAVRAAELAVARGEPTVVTPPVWSGLSEHHMALGATLTLDFSAFLAVLGGIVRSLARHGFDRILFLNGHGGNIAALRVVVEELQRHHPDIRLVSATYWDLAGDLMNPVLATQRTVRHACEAETSMLLALRPELVDPERLEEAAFPDVRDQAKGPDDGSYRWRSFAAMTPSGALGDPRAATAEKGERLLQLAAERLAEKLAEPVFWGEAA
ncbi:MAG: creatininase family protein [Geminicoccaceae bacterium]|nr:MAG: creatininase family protein [Geminicoccaceae bacterium]